MGLKGALFLSLFGLAILAAPAFPLCGLMGYLGHYYLWPENQWWGAVLQREEIRVSFSMAALTAIGVALNWSRLRARISGPLFHSQELLLWGYVGIIGLSLLWGVAPNPEFPMPGDPPLSKLIKVALFVFLLTHIVTTPRDLHYLLWFMLIVGGGYLGWEAATAPPGAFTKGRLDRMGGPDFAESSFLGAHFAMMGALAGALFLRGGNSIVKGIALVLGGLVFNGMVLTRTRAAYVAVLIGAAAAFYLAGRSLRRSIAILMIVGLIGGLALTDNNFWERMDTMQAEEIDRSASTRLEFWQASLRMYSQHPLGVGAGNFFGQIGLYLPEHPGRDTHNTYLRCLAELGAAGVIALLALMANAFRVLHKCKTIALSDLNNHALYCDAWGLQVMLVIFLSAGCFMTMTYTEELFFLLSLPACLERAVVRAREELMPVFADQCGDEYCELESDELELMTCEQ